MSKFNPIFKSQQHRNSSQFLRRLRLSKEVYHLQLLVIEILEIIVADLCSVQVCQTFLIVFRHFLTSRDLPQFSGVHSLF